MAVALACLAGAGRLLPLLAVADVPAEQGRLPELVRTKHQTFSIPFRLPAAQDADAAPQRVVMSVSKDLGGTWEAAGETAPSAGTFTYKAGADGEYWFRLRAIDRKGRARGGEGPDMRVLVDAAGPRLAARVWNGADGEILCRYAAIQKLYVNPPADHKAGHNHNDPLHFTPPVRFKHKAYCSALPMEGTPNILATRE